MFGLVHKCLVGYTLASINIIKDWYSLHSRLRLHDCLFLEDPEYIIVNLVFLYILHTLYMIIIIIYNVCNV
jgi:hypothetical protein